MKIITFLLTFGHTVSHHRQFANVFLKRNNRKMVHFHHNNRIKPHSNKWFNKIDLVWSGWTHLRLKMEMFICIRPTEWHPSRIERKSVIYLRIFVNLAHIRVPQKSEERFPTQINHRFGSNKIIMSLNVSHETKEISNRIWMCMWHHFVGHKYTAEWQFRLNRYRTRSTVPCAQVASFCWCWWPFCVSCHRLVYTKCFCRYNYLLMLCAHITHISLEWRASAQIFPVFHPQSTFDCAIFHHQINGSTHISRGQLLPSSDSVAFHEQNTLRQSYVLRRSHITPKTEMFNLSVSPLHRAQSTEHRWWCARRNR